MQSQNRVCPVVWPSVVLSLPTSSGLFERYGDAEAHHLLSLTITPLTRAATDNGGILVNTIGDEVMVSFEERFGRLVGPNGEDACILLSRPPITTG